MSLQTTLSVSLDPHLRPRARFRIFTFHLLSGSQDLLAKVVTGTFRLKPIVRVGDPEESMLDRQLLQT